MSRIMTIVGLVGALLATGVAGASPASQVRVPATVTPADDATDGPGSVVVERGDHLWKISARQLGEGATNDDITPYWREVVDVNTPRLRSGDPDLIFPGEVVELPAIRARR